MGSYSSDKIAHKVAKAKKAGWPGLDLDELGVRQSDLLTLFAEPGVERLQQLRLAGNELSSLPISLGALTNLLELYLFNNQISSLPESLGNLTALRTLVLNNNQLAALPDSLGDLTALYTLGLNNNQLSFLPDSLGNLTALHIANLNDNRLSSLPESLGNLTALRALYLGNNQLSSLPGPLTNLAALCTLFLSNNRLSSLPESLDNLTQLNGLLLSDNRLSSLPESIGALTRLERLNVSGNRLTALPQSLWNLSSLTELYLHGNDSLGIPPEILGPTWKYTARGKADPAAPSTILDFYFRTSRPADRRPLNEVKVILVGQGSVGKTSLVKRIIYDTFDRHEQKTDGIYIDKTWTVPGKTKGEKVQVNFWDFGGQEIMHATHQFFLTRRSLYILVLDARKGENEGNIHYWLKIIRSFGGDSPILVVTNKSETHVLGLDETRLRKDYPSIKAFLKTSCEKNTGITELKSAIQEQIHSQRMRHVFDVLPKAYFHIKKEMEKLATRDNYIDIRRYHALCVQHGITDRDQQDHLLRFLHDLGSVLSFDDPESPIPSTR